MSHTKQTPELPLAESNNIDDLYDAATALFCALEKYITTERWGVGQVREKIELPDVIGRKTLVSRTRAASPDNPLMVDEDRPLQKDDENGKNLWRTPVTIEVYDSEGMMTSEFCIDDSGRSTDGTPMPARALDMERDERKDDGRMSKLDAKTYGAWLANIALRPEEHSQPT